MAIPVAKPLLPTADTILPYLRQIDANRWYSNFGPLNEAFERRLAEHFGLPRDGLTTISNATVGLELALRTIGAPPGSHCVLPSWTFSASVHAVVGAGLIPYFVDVDEDGVLTAALARRALEQNALPIGAIMPVAPCGQPIDAGTWDQFTAETGMPVVVDAAPSFDCVTPGRSLSVVSLHATKTLGVGEGGFVMCTDPDRIKDVRQRSNFGCYGTREARLEATNGKLSEYAAAIGLAGLDHWSRRRASFLAVAARYRENFRDAPGVSLPPGYGETWIATTCIAKIPGDLDGLITALARAGIETRAWWGKGMHLSAAFKEYPRADLAMTDRLGATTVGLPCYLDMSAAEVDAVCEIVRERSGG